MIGWFCFFPIFTLQYSIKLRAVIDKNHPSSVMSQIVHIQIPEIKPKKILEISMRPAQNKDVTFFVDQSRGLKLQYSEELFHRVEKFFIKTDTIPKPRQLDVTFKMVSEFKENDEVIVDINYTLNLQIRILFIISVFSLAILTYDNFSRISLFAIFFTLFCQIYGLYDAAVYCTVILHYYINCKRMDFRKILIFTIFYSISAIFSLNGIVSFIFLNLVVVKDNQTQSLTLPYLFDILRLLISDDRSYSLSIFKLFLIAIYVYTNVVSKIADTPPKTFTTVIFVFYLLYLLSLLTNSFDDNEITAYCSMEPFIMTTPFINYTSKWLVDLEEKLKKPVNYSECDFCNFTAAKGRYKSNSNVNDTLVVTGFGKRDTEIEYFVRTFRTSHSKARIILFTNSEEHSERLSKILKGCNVILIDIPDFKNFHFLLKRKTRFPLMFDMLNTMPQYFNRVMYCDLYDTFFQGDPFTEEISNTSITTASEIDSHLNRWSYVRARKIAGWKWTKYVHEHNINSGFICASAQHMKLICELEISVYGPDFNVRSSDQMILNFLIYTGQFRYFGVDVIYNDSPVSHYPSIAGDVSGYDTSVLGNIYHKQTGVKPLLVHQYNRNWKYTKTLNKYCPGSEYKFTLKL